MKLIILSFILLFFSPLSWSDIDHETAKKMVEQGEIVSLPVILKKLKEMNSGKILEVELEFEDEHQGLVYEIELLSEQGKVLEYVFDARTGNFLEVEKED